MRLSEGGRVTMSAEKSDLNHKLTNCDLIFNPPMHNGLCKCLTGLAFFKSGIPLVWLISSYYAYIHLIARCLLGRGFNLCS